VTIVPPPELQHALDEAARKEGTTAESLALTLLSGILLPSPESEEQEPATRVGRSLADRLAYYIGAVDSGESAAAGAHGGTEYGRLLLKRHREGYP
jgi:hypothetical protein